MPLPRYMMRRKASAPPIATDPHFSSVYLLMKMDNTLTDSSTAALTMTSSGTSFSSTAQFGSHSLSLDSGYLSSASYDIPALESADWTIEAWIYRPTGIENATIMMLFPGCHLWVNASHQLLWDEGTQQCAIGGSVPLDQWVHVAAVRASGTVTIYVDGVNVGTSTIAPGTGPHRAFIGVYSDSVPIFLSNMLVDEVRVTVGVARYTAAFTPPSAAFPTS